MVTGGRHRSSTELGTSSDLMEGAAYLPKRSKDHETLHTYSLPGIVMCVRNALLSA